MDWREPGSVVSDYNTACSKPWLFPPCSRTAAGDCTKKDRLFDVAITEATKHLLQYCMFDPYQRRQSVPACGARSVVLLGPDHGRAAPPQWAEKCLHPNLPTFRWRACRPLCKSGVIGSHNCWEIKMQVYNSNISGSNAYLHRAKQNLEAFIEQLGPPSLWFSFSIADNHTGQISTGAWEVWSQPTPTPTPTTIQSPPREAEAQHRRTDTRSNPHLVGFFFFKRIKAMLNSCFWQECVFDQVSLARSGVAGPASMAGPPLPAIERGPRFDEAGINGCSGRAGCPEVLRETSSGCFLDPAKRFTDEGTQYDDWVTEIGSTFRGAASHRCREAESDFTRLPGLVAHRKIVGFSRLSSNGNASHHGGTVVMRPKTDSKGGQIQYS